MSDLEKAGIQIIPGSLGSAREGRFGDRGANWFYDLAAKREDLMVDLLDLRNWPLSFFNAETAELSTTNANKEHSDV
jgi:hypothetical protein